MEVLIISFIAISSFPEMRSFTIMKILLEHNIFHCEKSHGQVLVTLSNHKNKSYFFVALGTLQRIVYNFARCAKHGNILMRSTTLLK